MQDIILLVEQKNEKVLKELCPGLCCVCESTSVPSECEEIESWVSSDREGMRPEQPVPASPKNENGFSY